MKLLEVHCSKASYEVRTKALNSCDEVDAEDKSRTLENVLVVFTSVEAEDNEELLEKAVSTISNDFITVKAERILLYPYAHLSSNLAKPNVAKLLLAKLYQLLKAKNFEVYKSPFGWYKSFSISCLGHPLSELSKTITKETKNVGEIESQSLKTESETKSVFYIMNENGDLVEASNFDFSHNYSLKAFYDYEVKKVRAYTSEPVHIKLMKEQSLISYEPASDSGHFRWLPKGHVMKKIIEEEVSRICVNYGAARVETPIMYDYEHPALAKYLNRFPARQYTVQSDERKFFLRFSACFGQFLAAHDSVLTYKMLPFKIYELTHYSFRREQSGELAGLKRLRAFSMPDMHSLCANLKQAKEEFGKQYELCRIWNEEFHLPVELAFRVQRDFFEENKDFYKKLVAKFKKPVLFELFDKRYAYFITKFEMNYIDSILKGTSLSTVQIDVENGETFDLNYVNELGKKEKPIILHTSISGSVERVVYAILEREGAKTNTTPEYEFWLSPVQVFIIPVSEAQVDKALELGAELRKQGFRTVVEDSNDSLGKKVRSAEKEWANYLIILGEKEVNSKTLSIRQRGSKENKELNLEQLIKVLEEKQEGKIREALSLPLEYSKWPLFS